MNTTTIRPGILVSLKSTVSGGVHYQRTDLDNATTETGSAQSRWETTRVIDDPAEHQRAIVARSKALSIIRRVCSKTSFGLLCPEDRLPSLTQAVEAAREIATKHNELAQVTNVQIYILMGRIASTDEEAARAVGDEVRGLMESMNQAIDRLDVEAIRKAATAAREMAAMLSDVQQDKVNSAIAQARKAARTIVQRIEKDGETASIVLADIQRGSIEKARIAFLDFDAPPASEPCAQHTLPAVTLQRFDDVLDDEPLSTPDTAQRGEELLRKLDAVPETVEVRQAV